VVTSTDDDCSNATAWHTVSSATSITSFSWCAATAAASAHSSSSACLDLTMVRERRLMA
jgi:hypothetical protein